MLQQQTSSQQLLDRQFTVDPHVREYQHLPRFNDQVTRLKEFYIPLTGDNQNSFIERQAHLHKIMPNAQHQQQQQQSSTQYQQPQQSSIAYQQQQQQTLGSYQQQSQFTQPLQQSLQSSQRGESNFDRLVAGPEMQTSQQNNATNISWTPHDSQRPTQRHLHQDLMSLASPLTIASHQLALQQQSSGAGANGGAGNGSGSGGNGSGGAGQETQYTQLFEQAKQKRLAAMQSILADNTTTTGTSAAVGGGGGASASVTPLRGAPTDIWALRAQTLKPLATAEHYAAAIAGSGHFTSAQQHQQQYQQVTTPSQHLQGSVMFLGSLSAQEHQRKYREQQEKHKQSRAGWKSYSDYRNSN
jgi:hypothetical protein